MGCGEAVRSVAWSRDRLPAASLDFNSGLVGVTNSMYLLGLILSLARLYDTAQGDGQRTRLVLDWKPVNGNSRPLLRHSKVASSTFKAAAALAA